MRGYPPLTGFPAGNRFVRTRGKRAVRFRHTEDWTVIDEPLLALANMDVISHYNYYHWMMFLITRMSEVLDRGLLDNRRIMIPEELESWMRDSLEVLGLPPDRIMSYRRDQDLILRDVQLITSFEYASHHLVRSLRAKAWSTADVGRSAHGAGRLVFLSRRNYQKRTLMDEELAGEMAKRHGFEVVHPEELSILDQIRLFSQAAGIAGQVGAAFTNLMFAPDGARVLAITKEEMSYPTFVDLCVVLNQQYRWLLGWTEGNFRNRSQVNTPYRIDFELLDRELAWVSGGRDASPSKRPSSRRRSSKNRTRR
jgi:capsular polysaccharide biosynthesis protein